MDIATPADPTTGMVSVELLNIERATSDRLRADGDKLRAEIEQLQYDLQTKHYDLGAVLADNERLRGAIRKTAGGGTYDEIAIRRAVSFELAELIVDARSNLP